MNKASIDVLGCFWLPPNYFNTCISGVNQNTIETYSASKRNLDANKHFQESILPLLRSKAEPYPSNMKYLPKSESHPVGFRSVVNDALKEVYANRKGYVFSKEQLLEVLRFVPTIKVSYSDEIYFVWN